MVIIPRLTCYRLKKKKLKIRIKNDESRKILLCYKIHKLKKKT